MTASSKWQRLLACFRAFGFFSREIIIGSTERVGDSQRLEQPTVGGLERGHEVKRPRGVGFLLLTLASGHFFTVVLSQRHPNSGRRRKLLFLGNLLALLARLRECDCDGLLAVLYLTAFAALTAFGCTAFVAVHFALYVTAGTAGIFAFPFRYSISSGHYMQLIWCGLC